MSLGLKRGVVQLEPHDKQWNEIAVQTIKTLKAILGDDVIDIQHIGSTAIRNCLSWFGCGTPAALCNG